jgi:hypothetical protein
MRDEAHPAGSHDRLIETAQDEPKRRTIAVIPGDESMSAQATAALNTQTIEQTLAYILPRAVEMKWASIPWQTDLWEARRLAAEQGKPIFAWMMNGNPLGCV